MTPKNTALNIKRILSRGSVLAALAAVALITGCATRAPGGAAPVEDRGSMSGRTQPTSPAPVGTSGSVPLGSTGTAAKLPLGAENAGKPGYYAVRPGDTLIRIGLETGQSWRDIARWNSIDNPNILEVGQVIRIIPPGTSAVAAPPLPPATPASAPVSDGVVTRPVTSP
ncbi:MAG: LysM peptidoglycan-binding domain-containing protein, partial [Burkholderiales bacterium]